MYFYLLFFGLLYTQAQPPNLIIFLADDLGYNDLGCFGSIAINTPNIDRLASEGMKLTQFYSTAPLCSGSRAALLTGRLPQRSGVYTNDTYPNDLHYRVFLPTSYGSLPATELTIANFLSQENYYTKLIGKWHLGHRDALPTLRGFHSFFGLPYSHEEGFPGPQPESWIFPPVPLMRDEVIIEQPVNLSTLTPKYTQEAINFLNNMSNSHQSFYLHMAYEQPHIPLFASKGWNSNSRRGMYGNSVSEMDASIGVIMNELKILGMNNNTLVIFASDNGAWPDPGSGTAFQPNSISVQFLFEFSLISSLLSLPLILVSITHL